METLLEKDYSQNDWKAILDMLGRGVRIKIYVKGETVDGVRLSPVQTSILDFCYGAKTLGKMTREAELLREVFKKHFPLNYSKFKNIL